MEKLELKHLAPYLPYKLRVSCSNNRGAENEKGEVSGLSIRLYGGTNSLMLSIRNDKGYVDNIVYKRIKPILRPLSDLIKPIDGLGVSEYMAKLGWVGFTQPITNIFEDLECSYDECQQLFEWHFDVFGLIPKDLAIDINTLKS